jgi:hypothetical protein
VDTRRGGSSTCSNCRVRCTFCTLRVGTPRLGEYAGLPAGPVWLNSTLWTCTCTHASGKEQKMLWTICMVLLVLWLLGLLTSYTAGGLIHILLVVGLVILVIRLFQGRRIMS